MVEDKSPDKPRPLCFVIGPIGKEGTAERRHSDLLLNAIIKDVLRRQEFNYEVKRADEDADPGMIGDRVVTDIINSELVVADLTDLNPNAFYELGIRHSTELPTIHIAKSGTNLPFDNIAHRTIFIDLTDWRSIEDARTRLADSIRAIKAPSYKVSNPITQANASFKMKQSDDPRDRLMVSMQERIESLEGALSRLRPADIDDDYERDHPSLVILKKLAKHAGFLRNNGNANKQIESEIRELGDMMGTKITEFSLDKKGYLHMTAEDGCGIGTDISSP